MTQYQLDMDSLISLGGITKVSQILFYIVAGLTAVLTYRSAKRGLLNTVNTEYQKRVIDRLKELSDELASEFDLTSKDFWAKRDSIKELVDDINKEFVASKKQILVRGEWKGGVRQTEEMTRLRELSSKIATDPFIPKKIRDDVATLLTGRLSAILHIYIEELDHYRSLLAQGKHTSPEELEKNYGWVNNKIVQKLYNLGFGISQVEEAVGQVRLAIQDYLESFDPLHGEGRLRTKHNRAAMASTARESSSPNQTPAADGRGRR